MRKPRAKKKAHDNSMLQLVPTSKQRRDAGQALAKVAGVNFAGGHRGTVRLGKADAQLTLGANGGISIRTDIALPSSLVTALGATSQFPGNLRYTKNRLGGALVADTQVDGEAHLPHTFGSIRQAMMHALQRKAHAKHVPSAHAVDREVLQVALAELPWAEDGVVEQEDGWELRPRLRGKVVPVTMTIEPEGLRLSRTVLQQMPEAGTAEAQAAADQAVRINARLRYARLAVSSGQLVAEARLDSRLIQSGWIESTACAVAVAARHATTPLRLLAEQPAIANTYITTFCSAGEQPTPRGVGV